MPPFCTSKGESKKSDFQDKSTSRVGFLTWEERLLMLKLIVFRLSLKVTFFPKKPAANVLSSLDGNETYSS